MTTKLRIKRANTSRAQLKNPELGQVYLVAENVIPLSKYVSRLRITAPSN